MPVFDTSVDFISKLVGMFESKTGIQVRAFYIDNNSVSFGPFFFFLNLSRLISLIIHNTNKDENAACLKACLSHLTMNEPCRVYGHTSYTTACPLSSVSNSIP